MPKINFNQNSLEIDPNRSMSKVGGSESGEENLFAMLMGNIIGDEGESLDESSILSQALTGNLDNVDLQPEFSITPEQITSLEKELGIDLKNLNLKDLNLETLSKEDLEILSELENVQEKNDFSKIGNKTINKLGFNIYKDQDDSTFIDKIDKMPKKLNSLNPTDELKKFENPLKNNSLEPQINLTKSIQAYSAFDNNSDNLFIKAKNEKLPMLGEEMSSLTGDVQPISSENVINNKIENNLIGKLNSNSIDLNQIDLASKSDIEVLTEISNHLDKMKLSNAKELNVTVKHNDLGQFQINAHEIATKSDSNISLEILSNSKEVQNFFKINESNLTNMLSDKGISVGSFKISNSSESTFEKDFDLSQGDKSFSGQQQAKRENQNQDSQRRANLWQQYQERLGA